MSGDYKQPLAATTRTRFYDGQYLIDQDFIDEQKYHVDRQRRHLRTLHMSGIASGLDVTPGQGARVNVAPGTAIDRDGRQIVLATTWTSDEIDGDVYLYIAYNPLPAQIQESDQGVRGETRLEETALLFVYPNLLGEDDNYDLANNTAWNPATWSEYEEGNLPPPVVLAHLTLNGGSLSIDGSVRRYAGLRLPGGASPEPGVLRADHAGTISVATMTGGQFVPHLNLSANGNVGIGTTDTTRAKLAVSGDMALFGAHVVRFYNRLSDAYTEAGSGAYDSNSSNFWVRSADASHYGLFFDGDNGNVGIGTVEPQAQLHVGGSLTVAGAATLQQGLAVAGTATIGGSLKIQNGPAVNEFSSDASLADNSDSALPTERAVRGYVDGASNRLAARISTLEGANLNGRLSSLEGANLNGRLSSLEGANLNGRLSTLEGANLNGRLSTLERGKHPYGGSLNDPFTTNQLNIASGVNNFVIDSSDVSPNNGYIRFGDGTGWRLNFGRLRENSQQTTWNRGQAGVLMMLTDNGRLGLGTAPDMLLHLKSDANTTGIKLSIGDTYYAVRWKDIPSPPRTIGFGVQGPYLSGPSGGWLGTNTQFDSNDYVLAWANNASGPSVNVRGTFNVTGGSKNFAVPHPIRPDHTLVHACVEGPEAAVYYRGVAQLRNGRAIVRLPDYFEALTRQESRTVQLTALGEQPFLLSYMPITDGAFCVHGACAGGSFAWQVMAVRADIPELEVEVASRAFAQEDDNA